jgi:hypothetical protein
MAGFKDLVGKFVILGLLTLGLLSFIVITQSENDAPRRLEDNDVFNDSLSGLIDTIGNSTEAAEEKFDVFNSEEPKAGFASIVLFSIVSVGKTFTNIVFGMFGAVIELPLKVLGVPSTVYNLILTLLIIIAIVAVWLLYKLGG